MFGEQQFGGHGAAPRTCSSLVSYYIANWSLVRSRVHVCVLADPCKCASRVAALLASYFAGARLGQVSTCVNLGRGADRTAADGTEVWVYSRVRHGKADMHAHIPANKDG
jgi:hypothetical protein